ncbi:hypothetical protein [Noviherbaspirillum pedocola]|uniref:Uncharacterized protein n=1 Tax=Noviherbaspirillum pedocola TaxID=2801341 RepID=A0A934SUW8_9BURK|nr:hypothetical protein [Noviherbaspirillum pedocola]MBK4736177.1 hypothetical protein [Noviherbaspirillum pedocola]
MLDRSPFYANWPPKQWQQQFAPFERFPAPDLRVADFSEPAPNGVDPKWEGWVYVKANIWRDECKVGYTDGPIAGRLSETGAPDLILHAAFAVPWSGNNWAHWAEQHCFDRLGRHNMKPHLPTGETSELFPWSAEYTTELVARAMQEFYDHLWALCDFRVDVNAMRYEPILRPAAIKNAGVMNAPYFARRFNPFGY